ncbi:ribonucleoside-diphosphate reductase subunit alpha [Patescibacteria group bacterium]|nr:ribonucleoside-diphosphate reductase subunit alpha [Patescibacteria group bacterium]
MTTLQKIKKRNGAIVDFNHGKIVSAVSKAFLEVLNDPHAEDSQAIGDLVVSATKLRYGGTAALPTVEEVQDLVEHALMERGYYDVAKSYIIYRYEHAKVRQEKQEEVVEKIEKRELLIQKADGTREIFSIDKIKKTLEFSILPEYRNAIQIDAFIEQVQREVYDGITTTEVERTMIMVARSMIERDPAYNQLAAQLLLNSLYGKVLHQENITIVSPDFDPVYRTAFVDNVKREVELKILDERMLGYDLAKLAAALRPERDRLLKYMGVATLSDRYFIADRSDSKSKKLLETPQMLYMRVAMGLGLNEKENREAWAIRFYEILSTHRFVPSTPTLFHSGMVRAQLSSCYLNTVDDDLDNIFKVYGDNAQMSKWAGGIGTDWTNIRGTGAYIKKAGITSQGVIPFLKIANDVTVAINRSGRRRGATAVYLETWHYDVEDFLELRKNTGDERRRTHDMNTANWIPDLFMKRVREDGQWTLFSPDEVSDLHHIYGSKFEEAYVKYEKMADEGKIKLFKRMKAGDLWKKMLAMLYETGHPWITFKDPCNVRSPQDHVGVVHNSNLCTEITLNNSKDETAVCNLGWLNYAVHVTNGRWDVEKVKETVTVGMRMLDNVIDLNFYPTIEGRNSNMRHRPVGFGAGGFQDALYQLNINFASEECVKFADESMEGISYYSILASSELAKERGAYESYKGSKWDRGILPLDTVALLERERGESIDVNRETRLDWNVVRDSIKKYGMRNSNCMAVAPTASTSNIVSVVPSIEPVYKNIYVEANISGDFTVVNPYLVEDLKKLSLWNDAMLNELKYHDGSVAKIAGLPQALKDKYKETFEIDMRWLIKGAAYRGKWIDQSQSLNIFFKGSSGKELSEIYQYAWAMGLKTTYYLRSLAATQVEKSTVSTAEFGSTHKRDQAEGPQMSQPVAPTAPASAPVQPIPSPVAVQSIPVSMPVSAPISAPMSAPVAVADASNAPKARTYVLHRKPEAACESCE